MNETTIYDAVQDGMRMRSAGRSNAGYTEAEREAAEVAMLAAAAQVTEELLMVEYAAAEPDDATERAYAACSAAALIADRLAMQSRIKGCIAALYL